MKLVSVLVYLHATAALAATQASSSASPLGFNCLVGLPGGQGDTNYGHGAFKKPKSKPINKSLVWYTLPSPTSTSTWRTTTSTTGTNYNQFAKTPGLTPRGAARETTSSNTTPQARFSSKVPRTSSGTTHKTTPWPSPTYSLPSKSKSFPSGPPTTPPRARNSSLSLKTRIPRTLTPSNSLPTASPATTSSSDGDEPQDFSSQSSDGPTDLESFPVVHTRTSAHKSKHTPSARITSSRGPVLTVTVTTTAIVRTRTRSKHTRTQSWPSHLPGKTTLTKSVAKNTTVITSSTLLSPTPNSLDSETASPSDAQTSGPIITSSAWSIDPKLPPSFSRNTTQGTKPSFRGPKSRRTSHSAHKTYSQADNAPVPLTTRL